jgi:xylulokinase
MAAATAASAGGKPLVLGLDVGTQSTKAVLWSPSDSRVYGRGSVAYDLLPTTVPGRAEQHPSTWIDAVKGAVKGALAADADADATTASTSRRVAAISVSGQQHGMVLLDAKGQVVRPAKLWCDTESAAEAEELSTRLSAKKSALPPMPAAFTASKALWCARHEPDNWQRTEKLMLPHDYVNYWLTGGKLTATEASDASGTGVFDAAVRRFDLDAAAEVDARLPAMLLQGIAGPSECVGELCAEVAKELGLVVEDSAAGSDGDASTTPIKIGPGGGDNAMAALGAGVTRPGELVVSLGTSGTLFGVSGAPVIDSSGVVAPFCDAAGQWLPLACTLNCTVAAEEVRKALGLDRDELTKLAASEPPGCEGVSLLPFFVGERTPNAPHATGALLGLRPGHLSRPGLLYRACLEGCTFALRAALDRMRRLGMQQPLRVRLVGGGAANALWRQIVADALGLPVEVPPGDAAADGAALGAAFQAAAVLEGKEDVGEYARVAARATAKGAGVGAVVVQPDFAAREAYEAAFRRFVELSGRLFDVKEM